MLSYDMGYDKRKMATIPNEIDDESLLPNEAEDIIIQQIEDETSIEEPDAMEE